MTEEEEVNRLLREEEWGAGDFVRAIVDAVQNWFNWRHSAITVKDYSALDKARKELARELSLYARGLTMLNPDFHAAGDKGSGSAVNP